jgi:hypothetical protein
LKQLLLLGLEWLMDRLIAMQTPSRRPLLDYHIHTALPDHILAIIRVSWYTDGKPDCVNELVLLDDDETAMEAFAHIVGTGIALGANVSIRSPYQPEELGIRRDRTV